MRFTGVSLCTKLTEEPATGHRSRGCQGSQAFQLSGAAHLLGPTALLFAAHLYGSHARPASASHLLVTSLSLAEHRASCLCFPEQSRETQSCPSPLDMYSAPQHNTAMHTARPPGGTTTHLPGQHPTRGQRRAGTQKSILHVAGLCRTTCDLRRRPTLNLSLPLRGSPP